VKRFTLLFCGVAAAVSSTFLGAQTAGTTKPLDIYVVDPEGGKATLFVTPAGQAVLIDTGSPGERDVSRIMEAISAAGVTKLDYLISTHYHVDHVGGLHEFATVTVGNDLATVSEYECLSEGPLGMPPGTLVLVRDAWVAYDRTEYGRWGMTLEEERADAARGWGGGYGGLLPSGDGGGEEDE